MDPLLNLLNGSEKFLVEGEQRAGQNIYSQMFITVVLKLISAWVNQGRTSLSGYLAMIFKFIARSSETNCLITWTLVKTNTVNTRVFWLEYLRISFCLQSCFIVFCGTMLEKQMAITEKPMLDHTAWDRQFAAAPCHQVQPRASWKVHFQKADARRTHICITYIDSSL